MNLSFRSLTRSDFPIFQKWLAEPHVEAWWHEPADMGHIEKKYGPRVDGLESTFLFIILSNEQPIGWIQWYRWRDYSQHARQLGAELDEAGIDLAIGEVDYLGRGVGAQVIEKFIQSIVFSDSAISGVVTDPEELNVRSIRAFEKAGFSTVKSVQLENEEVFRRVVRLERRY